MKSDIYLEVWLTCKSCEGAGYIKEYKTFRGEHMACLSCNNLDPRKEHHPGKVKALMSISDLLQSVRTEPAV